jgi:hypothetical protein
MVRGSQVPALPCLEARIQEGREEAVSRRRHIYHSMGHLHTPSPVFVLASRYFPRLACVLLIAAFFRFLLFITIIP